MSNSPKSRLTRLAEMSAILSLPALIFAALQLRDGRKALAQNKLSNEIQYSTSLLLPSWVEWKQLYYESQKLDTINYDFLARADVAQDNWNVRIHIVRPEARPMDVIETLKRLMTKKDLTTLQNTISTVLSDTIQKELDYNSDKRQVFN